MQLLQGSFQELGYAIAPSLAQATELSMIRAAFPSTDPGGPTAVHRFEPELVLSWEACDRARAAVNALRDGDWNLEFAQGYCKPPSSPGARIPWHQDRAFWSSGRGFTVTTWIALDPSTSSNGCLWVRPGSHQEAEVRAHVADSPGSIPSCSTEGTQESQPIELSEGAALLYHERLIHCSGGNGTEAVRRALVLGWTAG